MIKKIENFQNHKTIIELLFLFWEWFYIVQASFRLLDSIHPLPQPPKYLALQVHANVPSFWFFCNLLAISFIPLEWNYHAFKMTFSSSRFCFLLISSCATFIFILVFYLKCLIYLEFYFGLWSKIYQVRNIASHSSLFTRTSQLLQTICWITHLPSADLKHPFNHNFPHKISTFLFPLTV